MKRQVIVMLGTDLRSPGGITAVVRSYQAFGLFEQWPLRYLATFHLKTTANRLATAALAWLRLAGWLLRGEVALVHAHTAARGSFWRKAAFLLLARAAGVRTVLHLHDGSFPGWYSSRSAGVQRFARWLLRSVDRVALLTEGWRDWLLALEPRARCVVLHNPVAVPREAAVPQAGQLLFLGRLWQEKGVFDLIDALALVHAQCPQVHLVCAGDGDHAAVLAHAQARGVAGCLTLPGWLDGAAKAQALAQAAVFVLPSYAEGLPVGVLEAMAFGLPVVATRVGGVAEALGPGAGLLCEPGDVPALAQALLALLQDPARAAALGAAGRMRAAQVFSGEKVMQDLNDLYVGLGLQPEALALPSARGGA